MSSETVGTEVVVGRIGRPHGVRGEVSVEPRTDEPDRRFVDGAVLLGRVARGTAPYPTLTVRASRWHQGRLLVRFDEIADRNAAEAARGLLLATVVSPDERPEDPEEFYDHQIVGLLARTTDGVDVGTVTEVLHTSAQDLLVIRRVGEVAGQGGGEVLVPFVSALVPEVDLDAGRLLIADRPGLLDPAEAEVVPTDPSVEG